MKEIMMNEKTKSLAISQIIPVFTIIGILMGSIFFADDRWNQSDEVKVLEDRISAQLYRFELSTLRENINYLKDKRQYTDLSIPESRRLERLQSRYNSVASQWDEMAKNYGTL
jgi:hypothetical protein